MSSVNDLRNSVSDLVYYWLVSALPNNSALVLYNSVVVSYCFQE